MTQVLEFIWALLRGGAMAIVIALGGVVAVVALHMMVDMVVTLVADLIHFIKYGW